MKEIIDEYVELCKDLINFENTSIPLCAAQNYVSDFCMNSLISPFEGKYSFVDNNGQNSFVGGEYVERLNNLLKKQCHKMFGATYTNTETLTGINCFTVCAMSLLSPKDKVLITTPEQGGHASIPIILSRLGIKYDAIPYDYSKYQINYEELNTLCKSQNYTYLIFCQSDLIIPPDLMQIKLPEHMGVIYDATQTIGLIASGIIQNPLSILSKIVLIGGSHKTLPAPSCGIIMSNHLEYQKKLRSQITPDYLRNTQPNHSAALLLSLIEQEKYGHDYQNLVVKTANMLGRELSSYGFNVAKPCDNFFTYTHQIFLLLSKEETDDFYIRAKKYNITLNKKHKKLFNNDGIRIGCQQISRYNWDTEEIKLLAQLIYAIKSKQDNDILKTRNILLEKKIPHFTCESISIE